jgi:hypothetical protein
MNKKKKATYHPPNNDLIVILTLKVSYVDGSAAHLTFFKIVSIDVHRSNYSKISAITFLSHITSKLKLIIWGKNSISTPFLRERGPSKATHICSSTKLWWERVWQVDMNGAHCVWRIEAGIHILWTWCFRLNTQNLRRNARNFLQDIKKHIISN